MDNALSVKGWVRYGIIAAALVTAAIHVILGVGFLQQGGVVFILNAVGFVGLTAVYFFPYAFFKNRHELVRWVLVGFSAVTILLWVVMNGKLEPAGVAAKLAEIALIVLLVLDRGKK